MVSDNVCDQKRSGSWIWRELLEAAILGTVGVVMTWLGLTCRNCYDTRREFWIVASFAGFTWILLWKGNAYIAGYIGRKHSWIDKPIRPLIIGILATSIYTTAALHLMGYIYLLAFGVNFTPGAMYSIIVTMFITLFMQGRSFLLNWKQSVIDSEKLKKETIAAQYESLKNQVNPHFLFNSLNALTNIVADNQQAVKFIKQLSEVYRYVLETRDREVVSISEELDFLRSYLYLQQMRFGGKLRVNIGVEGREMSVPPLALQMLIENAIKHNIVSEEDPLSIDIRDDGRHIVVENNIQRKSSSSEPSTGIGLENISKRYAFLTKEPVQVSDTGNRFVVRLPVLNTR